VADILYVQDGYVANGYVQATRISSTSPSATSTLTVIGVVIRQGQATLEANQSGLTWAEMGTWAEPKQEYWGPNFTVTADKFLGGTANMNSIATASSSATFTANPTVGMTGLMSATMTANIVGSGIVIPVGSFTASVVGARIGKTSASMSASGASTATGILQAKASVTPAIQSTLSSSPNSIVQASGTITNTMSASIDGDATKRTTLTLNNTLTVSADGIISIGGTANITGTATLNIPNTGIFITRGSTATPSANLSINLVAGLLAESTVSFGGVLSTLTIGSQFAIDPFRVYTVPTESRINILQQETRNHLVPSETRKYQVQHLTLVDETGILDRREG